MVHPWPTTFKISLKIYTNVENCPFLVSILTTCYLLFTIQSNLGIFIFSFTFHSIIIVMIIFPIMLSYIYMCVSVNIVYCINTQYSFIRVGWAFLHDSPFAWEFSSRFMRSHATFTFAVYTPFYVISYVGIFLADLSLSLFHIQPKQAVEPLQQQKHKFQWQFFYLVLHFSRRNIRKREPCCGCWLRASFNQTTLAKLPLLVVSQHEFVLEESRVWREALDLKKE